MAEKADKNWKLQLRYGKLTTNCIHLTLIGEGHMFDAKKNASSHAGPAFMAMKVWASSYDETTDMIRVIGEHFGYRLTGSVQIYETDPEEPPGEEPFGYGMTFSPYTE